jgi:hypothetical protein
MRRRFEHDGDGHGVLAMFESIKLRQSVEVGFPENLAENSESLGHSRNVSIILDMSRPFSVSSRCLVCITGYTALQARRREDVALQIDFDDTALLKSFDRFWDLSVACQKAYPVKAYVDMDVIMLQSSTPLGIIGHSLPRLWERRSFWTVVSLGYSTLTVPQKVSVPHQAYHDPGHDQQGQRSTDGSLQTSLFRCEITPPTRLGSNSPQFLRALEVLSHYDGH